MNLVTILLCLAAALNAIAAFVLLVGRRSER